MLKVSSVEGDRFLVSGTLPAGRTVTVTYQVTVKDGSERGNNAADNYLVHPGDNPPAVCEDGNLECTHSPLSNVAVEKSADPASGQQVQAGQRVTYTLTFRNTGQTVGEVDYTDNLAQVLDDATLAGPPIVSDVALSATNGNDGKVRVTGQLAKGQVVTVTYSVVVNAENDRGDNQLLNIVGPTGPNDPACTDTGVSCTVHPVSSDDPISPLALTGSQIGLAALLASLLMATGIGLVVVRRKRRVELESPSGLDGM